MIATESVRVGYTSTTAGQFRYFSSGSGPVVVAVSGLASSAEKNIQELQEVLRNYSIIVIEPPGIGGSSRVTVATIEEAGSSLADAIMNLTSAPRFLIGIDLSAALIKATIQRLSLELIPKGIHLRADPARAWSKAGIRAPDLEPRQDGLHLNAQWVFLRDRDQLEPENDSLPRSKGTNLSSTYELNRTFVAASVNPTSFSRLWNLCSEQLVALPQDLQNETINVASFKDLETHLGDLSSETKEERPRAPTIHRSVESQMRNEYVQTTSGLAHLRRAGHSGKPIFVLPTGGGSCAQFEPVIKGLARNRTVIGVDYFGNGLSDKAQGETSISDIAREIFAIMDALEIETTDVWGSHTGACVGLEMSIQSPTRVGRLVMEGPVVVSPEFRDDILEHYFPDFSPEGSGAHLQRIWHWRRDMFMFWPWYRRELEAARQLGIPHPDQTHMYAVGILESSTTYSRAYRAAFAYPTLDRLQLLTRPSIITAGPNDMLANALEDTIGAIPPTLLKVIPTPTTVWWPHPDPTDAKVAMDVYLSFLND